MDAPSRTTHDTPTEDRAWPGSDQIADPVIGAPPADDPPKAHEDDTQSRRRHPNDGRPNQRKLPLKTRIVLGVVGGLLEVLGIAGLFLPFLQGILFMVLGAAVLSLTSDHIYGWLYNAIGERWPGAWDRLERFRTRVRWKFRR